MRDLLVELNQEVGIKGSMILTADGVVVASEVASPLNGDQVAAIASNSIQLINRSLMEVGAKDFTKFMFSASYGKMIFMGTGAAYLVVVLDKSLNIDFTILSIESAARKVRSLTG